MGRKAYPKIKLTEDEISLIEKIVRETKCYWFTIAGRTLDLLTGKKMHFKSDDYDCVWDANESRFVSLQFGLKILLEAYDYSTRHTYGLDEKEKSILARLTDIAYNRIAEK